MDKKEKKALYESIMMDVAKIVKRHLTESSEINEQDNFDDQEIVEFDSLEDITEEQYYNPALNKSFSLINDDYIFFDQETNQIGMDAEIEDKNGSGETQKFQIWAESFGKMLEYFDIAVEASTQDVHDKFFRITTNPVMKKFWKAWRRHGVVSDEANDKLDDNIDDFYVNAIEPAENIADVVEKITNMQY